MEHSAVVLIDFVLVHEDKSFAVAQLGPHSVILREPEYRPGPLFARINLSIDGTHFSWTVVAPEGIDPQKREVIIETMPHSEDPMLG